MRMFKNGRVLICCITFLLAAQREDALLVPLNRLISTTKGCMKKSVIKIATVATALVCVCGLPTYSNAAEQNSLETQLRQLQDIKVANQKRRIEAAESELQSQELLYPEGRLIGRGIVKLMPESGEINGYLSAHAMQQAIYRN